MVVSQRPLQVSENSNLSRMRSKCDLQFNRLPRSIAAVTAIDGSLRSGCPGEYK
jgi:hypothetical protein